MYLRKYVVLLLFSTATFCQSPVAKPATELPNAPSHLLLSETVPSQQAESFSAIDPEMNAYFGRDETGKLTGQAANQNDKRAPPAKVELDANGNPIPLERREPKRILGFMPNFRSVSSGAVVHPLGWKYNFTVATHQATDYSSFIFLGITSLTAEGMDSHAALGKGVHGYYAYTWRGFLDKTDGTYLAAWLLPSLLHEDTRYYVLGRGSILKRSLYVISRQAVARTYGGADTPNFAGLGSKVLTQVISREYYPSSATDFSALATKFGYSVMRDVGFTAIREFYPTSAAHFVRKHHEHERARQLKLQQQQQP